MNLKQSVQDYLEDDPRFRERSNKDKGIVNLLARKYHVLHNAMNDGLITRDMLVAIIQDASTADRCWRQALQNNPNLRGTDYEDKKILEQEKQLELGYTPGYEKDVKALKKLV